MNETHRQHSHKHKTVADAATAIDPVCGMTVKITPTALQTEHGGKSYYFCSPRCRDKFEADPSRFTTPQQTPTQPPAAPGVKWTCPMHPEIVRRGVVPDIVTDQTSAHDTLNGYVPAGLSLQEAAELRRRAPRDYVARSTASKW